MRKSIIMKAVLCVCVLLLCGCVGVTHTSIQMDKTIDDDKDKNTHKDNKKVPKRENGSLHISLGFSTNMQDPRAVASTQFKQEVEEKTDGSIIVDIYPDSELGSDASLISKVMTGHVDMTISSAGNFSGYVKNEGVSALPFLFENFEQAWTFMDSSIIKDIDDELLQFNIRVLSHFDNGFRCVTTMNNSINDPEDLVGLKIRVPDNAIVKETMSQLGAKPITLAFSELKQALKDGVFDAQENPIPVIYNNQIYEVQNCLSVTNHSYDAMPFVISQTTWQMLTKEEQKIISKAAENAQKTDRELVKKQTEEYVSKLQNECGMTIVYPDLTEFKKKTQNVARFFCYDERLLEKIDGFLENNID